MTNNHSAFPSVIIGGYERGGTTLLSDILRSNGYESGFECGVLMCQTPREYLDYHPYVDMLPDGWGVTEQFVHSLCQTMDHEEFYGKLIAKAFGGGDKNLEFFDKTPIYMSRLGLVMKRARFAKKFIVIHRDPRAVFVSWAKRQNNGKSVARTINNNLDSYADRYLSYFIGAAAYLNDPRVLFVSYEGLCVNEDIWCTSIGKHCRGTAFSPRSDESRFDNTFAERMCLEKIFEYEHFLTKRMQEKILTRTRLASMFFCELREQIAHCTEREELFLRINNLLEHFDLQKTAELAHGESFDPFTYLLRYNDVLNAKINPLSHYLSHGIREGRLSL